MDAFQDFRSAMRADGLQFTGDLCADGVLHRFKANGDHNRNSWYVIHCGPPAAGAFGCWKRGLNRHWSDRNAKLSRAERDQVSRHWAEAEIERKKAVAERQAKARKTAEWIWSRSIPVQVHPYLERKGISAYGELREYRGALVLALKDAAGILHSLQFVAPDGTKNFLSGGPAHYSRRIRWR